jgi:hypothetical protein
MRTLLLSFLLPFLFVPTLTAQDLSPSAASVQTELPKAKPQRAVPQHSRRNYRTARLRPLTPRDVEIRESVEALGADKHRFVRCRLHDGSSVTGGILEIDQTGFMLSRGAIGDRRLLYSSLQDPPQPVIAPGEHVLVGLQWTGLVGVAIVAAPIILAAWPLGVLSD